MGVGVEDPLRNKDPAEMLEFMPNSPGTNNIGMVAWKLTMKVGRRLRICSRCGMGAFSDARVAGRSGGLCGGE